MILKFKLVFICAVFLAMNSPASWSKSSYQETLRHYIEQDRNDVASSIDGDSTRIFFIYIFNRLVPIPNRYVLKANEPGRHMLESMAGETIGRELLLGTIEVGTITNDEELGFHRKISEYELLYSNYEGMEIDIYRYKTNENPSPIQKFLVSNENEYLVIADQDPELWKYMLKASRSYP